MPTPEKKQKIEELTQKIQDSKAVFLTDYKGLPVNKIQELRRKLIETNSELQITKNTLLSIALEKASIKLEKALEGPTATLFAYGDELSPIKTIIEFSKENDQLPKLKIGFLDNNLLNETDLIQLSKLPNKETLISQVIFGLKSPLNGLAYSLNYHTNSLINILNNIKIKRESTN